ncbi:hypothetical protein FACS1894170_06480 [Planctomycetales bacterium]|nr:hypothetical protein FACS1894170_06480 [Planctomycetales bacterium]
MEEKRLLFACPVNYLDPSNGASIATREILLALAGQGWKIHTFCGCKLDFVRDENVWQLLSDRGVTPISTVHNTGGERFTLVNYLDGPIYSTLFLPEDRTDPYPPHIDKIYHRLIQKVMQSFTPQAVLTYGGSAATLRMMKMEGAKVAVAIHNCAYNEAAYTNEADLLLVPSQFSRTLYKDRLGTDSVPVPTLLKHLPDPSQFNNDQRQFVTMVNPDGYKGVLYFAAIVKALNQSRPDIPFLAVEGRGSWNSLSVVMPILKDVTNLYAMTNTMEPQDFLDVTKVMLVPSHFNETFGRVPVEAMMNGIPVIGSTRGSLPEVLGDAGILLNIPPRHTPTSGTLPTDDEIEPWIRAIIELWDNSEHYTNISRKVRERSERWDYNHVAQQYDEILTGLILNQQLRIAG